MKLKYWSVYLGAALLLLFFVPLVVVYTYNFIFFIEDLIFISDEISPVISYAIFFGIIGIFLGMFSAAVKFKLKTSFYINSIIGVIMVFLLFLFLNKPYEYLTISGYKEKVAFDRFDHNPTLNNAQYFLNHFSDSKKAEVVYKFKHEKLFDSAQKVNSPEIWEYFLSEVPATKERAKITSIIDDLYWEKATRLNSKSAYTKYLAHQPDGKYVDKAKGKIRRINKRDAALAEVNMDHTENENLVSANDEVINGDSNTNEVKPVDIITDQSENNKGISNSTVKKPTFGGQLTIEYQDGRKYIGNVINGEPNGSGKEIFPDGTVLFGNYENGKRDGKFIFTTINGERQEQVFRAGNRIK